MDRANYTTVQGDTWDIIAYKQYGNESLFPLLINANPQHATKVRFDAGVTLFVPAAPEEISEDLPPWKR
ncbi:tail protein X [Paenibacillus agilis]|uniref:Phage tail protein n=1 Tax=Paenibacillus agilis TaxID=3020863 RepID=A0A559IZK6_9BACL|nr:tail protein X [Paenibacillus agilis]TVX93050.1 phage tail protein [Paenibacillus agilis]